MSMPENVVVDAEFPPKLCPLLEGYANGVRDLNIPRRRYYVAYGGRGSAKSWSFARALLLLAMYDPLRAQAARSIGAG